MERVRFWGTRSINFDLSRGQCELRLPGQSSSARGASLQPPDFTGLRFVDRANARRSRLLSYYRRSEPTPARVSRNLLPNSRQRVSHPISSPRSRNVPGLAQGPSAAAGKVDRHLWSGSAPVVPWQTGSRFSCGRAASSRHETAGPNTIPFVPELWPNLRHLLKVGLPRLSHQSRHRRVWRPSMLSLRLSLSRLRWSLWAPFRRVARSRPRRPLQTGAETALYPQLS